MVKDCEIKMPLYARYGGPWLWLLDPGRRSVDVCRLDGGTWYFAARVSNTDHAALPPFDRVSLDVGRLWSFRTTDS